MDLTFREPSLADADELMQLMEQLGYPIEQEAMRRNILEYASSEERKAWVAVWDGSIAGCIAVVVGSYLHKPGKLLRIATLVVRHEYRGKGVGKALLSLAEGYAHLKECGELELLSAEHRLEAHGFYDSLGFEFGGMKKYFRKRL